MNTLRLKGTWNIVKGKLKQKVAHLTHDELGYVEGKEDELVGRILKRSAKTEKRVRPIAGGDCECCGH